MSTLERLGKLFTAFDDDAAGVSADEIMELITSIPKLLAAIEAANLMELRAKRIVHLLKALGHEGEAERLDKARIAYADAAANL